MHNDPVHTVSVKSTINSGHELLAHLPYFYADGDLSTLGFVKKLVMFCCVLSPSILAFFLFSKSSRLSLFFVVDVFIFCHFNLCSFSLFDVALIFLFGLFHISLLFGGLFLLN